jgi:hypothetical protein
MAIKVFTRGTFELGGVDLSDHLLSGALTYSAEMLDATKMGDNSRINKGGLKNWSLDVTLHQDYAAGEVDATLFALVGTTACFELRACSTNVGADNPRFMGTVTLSDYQPLTGGVGELLKCSPKFSPGDDLVRSVTAT